MNKQDFNEVLSESRKFLYLTVRVHFVLASILGDLESNVLKAILI